MKGTFKALLVYGLLMVAVGWFTLALLSFAQLLMSVFTSSLSFTPAMIGYTFTIGLCMLAVLGLAYLLGKAMMWIAGFGLIRGGLRSMLKIGTKAIGAGMPRGKGSMIRNAGRLLSGRNLGDIGKQLRGIRPNRGKGGGFNELLGTVKKGNTGKVSSRKSSNNILNNRSMLERASRDSKFLTREINNLTSPARFAKVNDGKKKSALMSQARNDADKLRDNMAFVNAVRGLDSRLDPLEAGDILDYRDRSEDDRNRTLLGQQVKDSKLLDKIDALAAGQPLKELTKADMEDEALNDDKKNLSDDQKRALQEARAKRAELSGGTPEEHGAGEKEPSKEIEKADTNAELVKKELERSHPAEMEANKQLAGEEGQDAGLGVSQTINEFKQVNLNSNVANAMPKAMFDDSDKEIKYAAGSADVPVNPETAEDFAKLEDEKNRILARSQPGLPEGSTPRGADGRPERHEIIEHEEDGTAKSSFAGDEVREAGEHSAIGGVTRSKVLPKSITENDKTGEDDIAKETKEDLKNHIRTMDTPQVASVNDVDDATGKINGMYALPAAGTASATSAAAVAADAASDKKDKKDKKKPSASSTQYDRQNAPGTATSALDVRSAGMDNDVFTANGEIVEAGAEVPAAQASSDQTVLNDLLSDNTPVSEQDSGQLMDALSEKDYVEVGKRDTMGNAYTEQIAVPGMEQQESTVAAASAAGAAAGTAAATAATASAPVAADGSQPTITVQSADTPKQKDKKDKKDKKSSTSTQYDKQAVDMSGTTTTLDVDVPNARMDDAFVPANAQLDGQPFTEDVTSAPREAGELRPADTPASTTPVDAVLGNDNNPQSAATNNDLIQMVQAPTPEEIVKNNKVGKHVPGMQQGTSASKQAVPIDATTQVGGKQEAEQASEIVVPEATQQQGTTFAPSGVESGTSAFTTEVTTPDDSGVTRASEGATSVTQGVVQGVAAGTAAGVTGGATSTPTTPVEVALGESSTPTTSYTSDDFTRAMQQSSQTVPVTAQQSPAVQQQAAPASQTVSTPGGQQQPPQVPQEPQQPPQVPQAPQQQGETYTANGTVDATQFASSEASQPQQNAPQQSQFGQYTPPAGQPQADQQAPVTPSDQVASAQAPTGITEASASGIGAAFDQEPASQTSSDGFMQMMTGGDTASAFAAGLAAGAPLSRIQQAQAQQAAGMTTEEFRNEMDQIERNRAYAEERHAEARRQHDSLMDADRVPVGNWLQVSYANGEPARMTWFDENSGARIVVPEEIVQNIASGGTLSSADARLFQSNLERNGLDYGYSYNSDKAQETTQRFITNVTNNSEGLAAKRRQREDAKERLAASEAELAEQLAELDAQQAVLDEALRLAQERNDEVNEELDEVKRASSMTNSGNSGSIRRGDVKKKR